MTQALARSNNQYFSILGRRLGFDRVHHYAEMLGLGELTGLDIPGERAQRSGGGRAQGGRRRHDDQFRHRRFQRRPWVNALLSAISNGGTLYYLNIRELRR